jgi:hypothetical protein
MLKNFKKFYCFFKNNSYLAPFYFIKVKKL